jgi:hypothetical protein
METVRRMPAVERDKFRHSIRAAAVAGAAVAAGMQKREPAVREAREVAGSTLMVEATEVPPADSASWVSQ